MTDPYVAEIRKYRMQHTTQFKSDLHLICEDLRKFERSLGDRVVKLSPRKLQRTKASTVRALSRP